MVWEQGDSSTGLVNDVAQGVFDPLFTMESLAHDLFEHFFECSELFRTPELSITGEAVAMGIREHLLTECNWGDYVLFNRHYGNHWNTVSVLEDLVSDISEGSAKYPLGADFNHDPKFKWDGKGFIEFDTDPATLEAINKAFSYGMWLGEEIYRDNIGSLVSVCERLKHLLKCLNDNMFEPEIYHYLDMTCESMIGKKSVKVVFTLDGNRFPITNRDSERSIITKANKFADILYGI
jgi:hypothetical protein